jgi:endonuclease/exonuclease/phosphatase family metal-dependent hydrolase
MCALKVRAPALMLEVMARELSIATWNCFGMAQTALDAITATRAPHGARLRNDHVKRTLDGAHLVCVQEVMSREAETFFDALGAARVRDPNGARLWPVTVRGSGLGIAGRLPFASHTSEIFASAGAGWDRLARKGTLHVRVDLDGLEIDIINVHLQAGYDAQAVAIRARQIGELARRVEQLGSEQRLFLLCGDFNVCGLGCPPSILTPSATCWRTGTSRPRPASAWTTSSCASLGPPTCRWRSAPSPASSIAPSIRRKAIPCTPPTTSDWRRRCGSPDRYLRCRTVVIVWRTFASAPGKWGRAIHTPTTSSTRKTRKPMRRRVWLRRRSTKV